MTQNSVSFSCQGKQVSRCCITFPHELICQISTNQCIKMGRRARPWWEKQLLTCLFKRAVFSRPKSVWNQNCVAHKHILFPVHWKNWTWACDHLKTSNVSADNIKNRELDGSTTVPTIRSCDTVQRISCFESSQLATTWMYNIRLQAPKTS